MMMMMMLMMMMTNDNHESLLQGKNKTEADERAQTKMETDDNVEAGKPEEEKADDLEEEKEEEVEMFYVKFKNL